MSIYFIHLPVHNSYIMHMRDGRNQLASEDPRVMLLELSVPLALNESAQVATADELRHQIVQIAVLEHKKEYEHVVRLSKH